MPVAAARRSRVAAGVHHTAKTVCWTPATAAHGSTAGQPTRVGSGRYISRACRVADQEVAGKGFLIGSDSELINAGGGNDDRRAGRQGRRMHVLDVGIVLGGQFDDEEP